MKRFGTHGPVNPQEHYVVARAAEVADFISRVETGNYIVLFAPRQTGKTTLLHAILETFVAPQTVSEPRFRCFPISLNFDIYRNLEVSRFYQHLYEQLKEQIAAVFQRRGVLPSESLQQLLATTTFADHLSLLSFFKRFSRILASEYGGERVLLLIDEFDGIPPEAVSDFLQTLRHIYISGKPRCPHSVGIVGVKSIVQLNYDRTISPFNIQDEFRLPNFTVEQVRDLLGQYTAAVGQPFMPEVITALHKQTAGQPVLVNRIAQILTAELSIPKAEPITLAHFYQAHAQLLEEDNVNIMHLLTNIRRDPRFEAVLMRITAADVGVAFNLRNEIIDELATYGVITRGADGMCEIINPIYLSAILKAFKPVI